MNIYPLSLLAIQDTLMEGKTFAFWSRNQTQYTLQYEQLRYNIYRKDEKTPKYSYEGFNTAVVKIFELVGFFL